MRNSSHCKHILQSNLISNREYITSETISKLPYKWST